MNLIDRLEKRARELDGRVRVTGDYVQQDADDRELFMEAAATLRDWGKFIDLLKEAGVR